MFLRTGSLEEHIGEAPELEMQVIKSKVFHSSLSSSAIVLTTNVVTDDNNKKSIRNAKNGTERLLKALLISVKAIPETDAGEIFDIPRE